MVDGAESARGRTEATEASLPALQPLVPAGADAVEVLAAHEIAVAVEVDADLVPRAAVRASALVREGRQRRSVHRAGQ